MANAQTHSQTAFNPEYKLIDTEYGVSYLAKNGLTTDSFDKSYRIPSNCGLVYVLPSGEVLVLETGLRDKYPAFLFSSVKSFQSCVSNDSFPVNRKDMTWLEAHAAQVRTFMRESEFYEKPLEKLSDSINVPFKTVSDCEVAYKEVSKFLNDKRTNKMVSSDMVYYYALAFAKFLISEKKYNWNMTKSYTVYNPYYYPEVVINKDDSYLNINIISKAFSAFKLKDANSFRTFYFYCTGIPPVSRID